MSLNDALPAWLFLEPKDTDGNEIKIGHYYKCARGIVGRVEEIRISNRRLVAMGKTAKGKHWQSIKPTYMGATDAGY